MPQTTLLNQVLTDMTALRLVHQTRMHTFYAVSCRRSLVHVRAAGEVLLTGADTAQDPHHAHGQPQPSQPSDLPPLGTWDPQGIRARRRAVLKSGRLSLSSFRAASRRGSLQSAQGSKRDPQDDTRSEQLFPLARVAPLCSQEGVGYDGRCVTDGGFSLVSCSNQGGLRWQGCRSPTNESLSDVVTPPPLKCK